MALRLQLRIIVIQPECLGVKLYVSVLALISTRQKKSVWYTSLVNNTCCVLNSTKNKQLLPKTI